MSKQKCNDTYINLMELDRETIDGHIKIKAGTTFWVDENNYLFTYIGIKKIRVCWVTSQNAFDYFVCNTDGNGYERAKLLNKLYQTLKKVDDKFEKFQRYFNDDISVKYCNDLSEKPLWSWDVYKLNIAPLDDLLHLIKITEKMI